MKLFLDDTREPPAGWVHTNTVKSTIEVLKTGLVEDMSLDHDLGATDPDHCGVLG